MLFMTLLPKQAKQTPNQNCGVNIITGLGPCISRNLMFNKLRFTETDQHFVNSRAQGLNTEGSKVSVTAPFQTN